MQFDHHTIYQIAYSYPDEDDWLVPVDISKFRKAIEAEEKRIAELNANRPKTGNKVLIKTMEAFGKQFNVLKKGDIVEELVVEEDTNPGRGIWVMGRTEPVKLVNDNNSDEWEYHEPNAAALAHEICQMTGQGDKIAPFVVDSIAAYIMHAHEEESGERWRWITGMCDEIGLPRRHYRNEIDRKITEYIKRQQLQTT